MNVNTARLLRLIKRPGIYVYIRPVAEEWTGKGEGLLWSVKIEQRKLDWDISEKMGPDLEELLQEVLDEMVPAVRRRPRPRRR